ncbi:hypothetical protein KGP36_06105, partial [Patescibacteria group bacterium]|nr:hypothetical protein [Patescibacteria group bacterium]
VKGKLPYGLIQPNRVQGHFWGRPEIMNMIGLQSLLGVRLDDYKRLMSMQYDKLLAFVGFDSMNDELYDQFRSAGYVSSATPGARVEDLTPKVPENALQEINMIIEMIDEVGGFKNILSGQGEPGVRAGNHAQMLLKTASPRLRDRALLVERQCADFGDSSLELLAAKEAKAYWVDETANEKTEFLLAQLPDDRRITVDSHSASPVYEDDHKEVVGFLAKSGIIDGESVLDLLPVPNRDMLKQRFKQMQAQKAQFLQEHPEMVAKMEQHGHK